MNQNKTKTIDVNPLDLLNGGNGVIKNLLRTFDTSLEEIVSFLIADDSAPKSKQYKLVLGNKNEYDFKVNQNGENVFLLVYNATGDFKTNLNLDLRLFNTNMNDLFTNTSYRDILKIKRTNEDISFYFDIKLDDGKITEKLFDSDIGFYMYNNKGDNFFKEPFHKSSIKKEISEEDVYGSRHTMFYDSEGNLFKVIFEDRCFNIGKKKEKTVHKIVYEREEDSLILRGLNGKSIDQVDKKWPREIVFGSGMFHCVLPKKDVLKYLDESLFERYMEIDRGYKNIMLPKDVYPMGYVFQTAPVDFDEFIEQIPRGI